MLIHFSDGEYELEGEELKKVINLFRIDSPKEAEGHTDEEIIALDEFNWYACKYYYYHHIFL